MKITKRQLRRIIREEKRKLLSETTEFNSQMPSELEDQLSMELQYYFEEAILAEKYQGTGPTWESEVNKASDAFRRALIDAGALKMILELWRDVEEGLHNGDYV
tara:strand:- start:464 stop:775 length:312 start_codon:yes stop_codon:yes gene_type:complete